MNKTIITKTMLLVIAIALSVGAILYYKTTVLDPPRKFKYENAHNTAILKMVSSLNTDSLESLYSDILYMQKRYEEEKLIGQDTLDLRLEDALVKYIPLFLTKCNSAFSASIWNTPEWGHCFMRQRISELKNCKKSNKTFVIERNSDYIKKLDNILNTLDKYDNAWKLANNTHFYNLEDTKQRISLAESYKNDSQLKNCFSLVQALNSLPSAIKSSHIANLRNSCKIYSHDISDYDSYLSSLKQLYNTRIPEFLSYYGSNDEVNQMKQELIQRQFSVLQGFISYALNTNNFDYYSSYTKTNTTVYNYINTYLGSSDDKQTLMNRLTNGALSESEFNNRKTSW